jgi:anaerobic selenocysteine-containing dehydrogenase
MYAGIEKLEKEGDFVQWGGPMLFADGFTKMPGNRARMSVVQIPKLDVPGDKFYFTTRRGKQFNSITYGQKDPLTGSRRRDDIFISPEDARRLKVADGEEIVLRSSLGEFRGRARYSNIREGNLQAYWPEGNVLIERRYDPISNEPDYNAVVEICRACDMPGHEAKNQEAEAVTTFRE